MLLTAEKYREEREQENEALERAFQKIDSTSIESASTHLSRRSMRESKTAQGASDNKEGTHDDMKAEDGRPFRWSLDNSGNITTNRGIKADTGSLTLNKDEHLQGEKDVQEANATSLYMKSGKRAKRRTEMTFPYLLMMVLG